MSSSEAPPPRLSPQERHDFLALTLEIAPLPAYWFDQEGRFRYANAAGCAALGYSLEELQTLHASDVNPRATPERWQQVFEILRQRGSVTIESVHRRKDGSDFPVELTSSYFQFEGREYCTGFAVDLSARQHAERERENIQAELLQAQKLESIGRLAGGVAHDFNNALTVAFAHLEFVAQALGSAHPAMADLAEVRAAAQRAAALTQQLLAFARRQPIAPQILDLNEVVDGMLKMLRRLIGEDITVRFQRSPRSVPVKMDPGQLQQVLTSLCVNGRDAIEGVGTVTISSEELRWDAPHRADDGTTVQGSWVRLKVEDTGRGMDAAQLKQVFEPFFSTMALGKGTGLGLATVHGIVKQNGGFVEVQSTPGAGTTLSLYLPLVRQEGATPDERDPLQTAVHQSRDTILLVEDEPAILSVLRRALNVAGYRVLATSSPAAAVQLADEHAGAIALLVSDVIMPEMNGRQLADRVSQLVPGLRCLFMSGYTADIIAKHGALDETVHFMEKPFTGAALAAKVRELLDSQAPARS